MTTLWLRKDLMADEGLRTTAYPDPLSGGAPYTIGYGHTGRDVHPGLVWDEAQCGAQLDADIATVIRALDGSLPWWRKLDDLRQDVLVNMGFNLGVAALMTFHHTLAAMESGDYATASAGMLMSKWAQQVGDRAACLAQQMKTGQHVPRKGEV